jgi:FkbM family methyltransferase
MLSRLRSNLNFLGVLLEPHGFLRVFHESLLSGNGGNWFDFEGLVRDIYISILRPGDVALDVGVNCGDHLLQMAPAVGPTGLVIGIEAAPAMLDITRELLVRTGLDKDHHIVLHNVAVSDKVGITKFHFVRTAPGLSSLAERAVSQACAVEILECQVTTIDNLLTSVDRRISFVKLDIEGSEYHALLGAKQLLERDRPPIVFEFDQMSPTYFGFSREDLLNLFHKSGYEIIDFFGFRYKTEQDLCDSMVWNYFAAPLEEIERFKVPELIRCKLMNQGVSVPAP